MRLGSWKCTPATTVDSLSCQDAFMKMVASQDHVLKLLRRFARGAYDENFCLPTWQLGSDGLV